MIHDSVQSKKGQLDLVIIHYYILLHINRGVVVQWAMAMDWKPMVSGSRPYGGALVVWPGRSSELLGH